MDRKKIVRLVIVMLVVATAAILWRYSHYRQSGAGNRLVLYGNVDIREADLAFNDSEHVEQILVHEGDYVEKGQLLATLHKARMQAQYAAAAAKVASRKAAVSRLEAGSRPEEIRRAQADVAAARARLHDAESSHRRTLKLYQKKTASRQAMDDARTALDTARANLKVAEESLALAVAGPRSEDIAEAHALLLADQAQLSLADEMLKDTDLFAPAAGIIRNRIMEPGEMASPQTPVLTLAMTNPLWVRTYVPETVLGKLRPGMPAEIATDSHPDKRYTGWIGFISPTSEFTPKNVETPDLRTRLVYQVRVYVCNPENELRLGMPATVTLLLDQAAGQTQATPDCVTTAPGPAAGTTPASAQASPGSH